MKSPPFFFCCSLFYTLHRLVVFGVPAVRAGGLVYVAVRCGAVLGLVDKLGDALTVRAGGFWQVFAGFAVLLMGSDGHLWTTNSKNIRGHKSKSFFLSKNFS